MEGIEDAIFVKDVEDAIKESEFKELI